ncbi:fibronectin-binding outer membrane protein CadF [Campylobacter hepaticus]|uniref:Fibronectin-binding outer membrane protein CadF n=1 Tax=Campylobacter hepaticus TaxID=1813019 RepID=A0A6A7JST7_9BACT|nr:fibronectin-binding outer membrane protein CadF [Campylobacter hepaticus]AXP08840.1 outer membrane beta-barrel domain-containing protein [Campylobacter hepaticus]MCZ0771873.1 fibronectin-binding outer membrane protein CadF [Campylobacter hepaticus]MCZ0773260.1 fibronectin-binding outer membrane protein CadF [Campylobacter hepaticus]MCZ0774511.1 fibronectin-binding outer membrane protein CadF [Campylobacter hepaticus]MDX2323930.1 fibronectin-binding outer membrane protein CadF [Campylobacter
MKKLLLCLGLASVLFGADNNVKFEITPALNYNYFEGNIDMKNRYAPGVRLGYHFDDFWLDQLEFGLEHYSDVKYKQANKITNKTTDITRTYLSAIKGIDLGEKFYFYGIVGGGYESFTHAEHANKSGGFGHYGAGVKFRLSDSLALRLETRDQINFNRANHNWVSTLGISFGFGGKKEEVAQEEVHDHSSEVKCLVEPREGALLDENGCEKTISLEGHFAFDKTTINPTFQEKIKEIAQILDENQRYDTILEGHTDNIGSRAYNQKLSERRAKSVAQELEKYGVDKSRIQTVGYGQDNPRSSNDTKEGRADNRRVDAKFILR